MGGLTLYLLPYTSHLVTTKKKTSWATMPKFPPDETACAFPDKTPGSRVWPSWISVWSNFTVCLVSKNHRDHMGPPLFDTVRSLLQKFKLRDPQIHRCWVICVTFIMTSPASIRGLSSFPLTTCPAEIWLKIRVVICPLISNLLHQAPWKASASCPLARESRGISGPSTSRRVEVAEIGTLRCNSVLPEMIHFSSSSAFCGSTNFGAHMFENVWSQWQLSAPKKNNGPLGIEDP